MNMILIPRNSADNSGEGLLRFALTNEPVAGVVLDGLCRFGMGEGFISRLSVRRRLDKTFYAVPEEWDMEPSVPRYQNQKPDIIRYKDNIPVPFELVRKVGRDDESNSWFVVSNGRFARDISVNFLEKVLAGVQADMVAVNVEPRLLSQSEKVRLTAEGEVAGFCRTYSDSAEFAFISSEWPGHLLIRTNVLDRVLIDGALPGSFSVLLDKCGSNALTLRAINVGGVVLDLETEDGLLSFCKTRLSKIQDSKFEARDSGTAREDSRFIGKVLLGKNVHLSPGVIIIGPTIISRNARIGRGAVINSSIIGPEVSVPENEFVQGRIIKGPQFNWDRPVRRRNIRALPPDSYGPFRAWPGFSYARCFKRIADCFAAAIVLILFAPVLILVALAIKLTSPGPVFYKDRRQGLHGKSFDCLKFRTMILGADKIQEILRIVSQVDGPQFKIANDPRIHTVGRFLRETYIDEIPQFFNVLFGRMSVVGPRPSPESENTLCPLWRDARLSVRPGITGLWQVYRTREPMKDFQEWIHYDTEYVRNLSLKMDLYICWMTAKKLLGNFIKQF
jgi:lipopolysaccharide/colanic/teichoic acid biosynthesis glycosyltransferase/NDP-sugar pyrophosphorylase family protein